MDVYWTNKSNNFSIVLASQKACSGKLLNGGFSLGEYVSTDQKRVYLEINGVIETYFAPLNITPTVGWHSFRLELRCP
jgi:hypothetical protein